MCILWAFYIVYEPQKHVLANSARRLGKGLDGLGVVEDLGGVVLGLDGLQPAQVGGPVLLLGVLAAELRVEVVGVAAPLALGHARLEAVHEGVDEGEGALLVGVADHEGRGELEQPELVAVREGGHVGGHGGDGRVGVAEDVHLQPPGEGVVGQADFVQEVDEGVHGLLGDVLGDQAGDVAVVMLLGLASCVPIQPDRGHGLTPSKG